MKKAFTILLALFTFFTFAEGTVGAQEIANIEISPSSYDFGDIYLDKGEVSTIFTVKNTGDQSLVINRLSTSCGCTTAKMDLSDLAPGESREMLATFDPMVHPELRGPITRIVYLQSSDPIIPELEIELSGNIIGNDDKTDVNLITTAKKKAVVFFNEACQDCGELVNEKYPVLFTEYEIGIEKKDYINERENRRTLTEYNEKWGVPFELQSHIEAFVGDDLLIGGHVPEPIIRYLIENPNEYEKLLVFQDKMHGEATDYKVWDFQGEIKTYQLDEPITVYLDSHKLTRENTEKLAGQYNFWKLFAVITPSAFLDGINPCAIAVLLFFIALLFSIKRTRKSIWKMGILYIIGVYLAYFLIGVGIAQAIIMSGSPHLMAYIGAYLVIGLGIIQLVNVVFPKFPIKIRIPVNTKATIEKWLYKSTLPAAFIGGFVVGLCTFPCSGGIYVAILGMLAVSGTQLQGIGWMLWYNLIFVVPLIILLALAANSKTTEKLQKWERKEAKHERVIIGFTMIALGLIIILFFI